VLSPETVRRILVLKLGGIGDMLMITPSLAALRQAYPRAWIAVIHEPASCEVVEGSGLLDELIPLGKLGDGACPRLPRKGNRVAGLAAVLRRVFRRFDLFVEFQNPYSFASVIKPLLVALACGARTRAGIDIRRRAFFLNVRVPENRFEPRIHSERYLDIIEALGICPRSRLTHMETGPEAETAAAALLDEMGVRRADSLIAIHPGGNSLYPIRTTWAPDRFVAVATHLLQRPKAKLLVTGTADDARVCGEIAAALAQPRRVVDLSGRTTLRTLAACFRRCRVVISNDTGPMHVAVAVGTPTVGIFGPGDWQAYGTYPPDIPFRMLRGQVDCWPCRDLQCTTRKCMNAVTVAQVIAAAAELLHEGGP